MMATLSATSAPSIAASAQQAVYHHSRTVSSSASATASPVSSPTHAQHPSTSPVPSKPSSRTSPLSSTSPSTPSSFSSSSSSPSSSFPSAAQSFPHDRDWNCHLPDIYGGARKGAKAYQEDAFCTFISPHRLVYIGGVFDGHGGYNGTVASCTARDYAYSTFLHNAGVMEDWTAEEWSEHLSVLFERMHEAIKLRFLDEPETANTHANSLAGGKRYVDDKGIVRSANGDPVHGGSTCTIIVMVKDKATLDSDCPLATIITANVGDSTALLLPRSADCSFLSVDHGPENPDEYARIASLPSSLHPLKLLFVYDKTNQLRKYDCPLVFLPSTAQRDPVYVTNPWGHGLHPTNVRYEPAVYAVTPKQVVKDSTCIAMTRALGDFYAHQFGLSWVPSIGIRRVQVVRRGAAAPSARAGEEGKGEGEVVSDGFSIILASDGIWDCWKYEDFHAFLHNLLHGKQLSIGQTGETALEESMERAIANFGNKHFDDACLITWQFQ